MMKLKLLLLLLMGSILPAAGFAQPIYVNLNATGANNGTSWANAFTTLQAGLDVAANGDEIWVAVGTYLPTEDRFGNPAPVDPRDLTFYFNQNILLYGGFLGNETSLIQRPACDTNNATILSGNIGSPLNQTDNCYNVCYSANLSPAFLMDCITITEGFSDGIALAGAAWYNDGNGVGQSSRPTIRDCYFKHNVAGTGGCFQNYGANGGNASPSFLRCIFRDNLGEAGGAMYNNGENGGNASPIISGSHFINNGAGVGGAIYNYSDAGIASPVISNTTFTENTSTTDGGAIYNNGSGGQSNGSITNCNFFNNDASGQGGAVFNLGFAGNANVPFFSCEFSGNLSGDTGGAITNMASSPTIDSCQFISNQTQNKGGAIFNNGSQSTVSSPFIQNTEFRSNACGFGGGAVFNDGVAGVSSPIFQNCKFITNSSVGEGGGVYTDGSIGSCSPQFWNCMFSRNIATDGGAIRCWSNGGTIFATFTNCSFARNVATNVASAFYLNGNSNGSILVECRNLISWGNTGAVTLLDALATLNVTYGIYENLASFNNTTCVSNCLIGVDPLFTNSLTHDLTLQSGSPAIDIGLSSFNSLPIDLGGDIRIQGPSIDLGAYESDPNNCPSRIHVDLDATGANNGSSWTDAFNSLQDGIELAKLCNVDTIWVAEGYYFPSQTPGMNTTGPNDRRNTFYVDFDVVILGGFNATETSHTQRNPATQVTVLSGEIGIPANVADNCYHVFTTQGVSTAMVLDGFTITRGNASASPNHTGAGVYVVATGTGVINSPTLRELIFTDNLSTLQGAGLYVGATNNGTANPVIRNCEFNSNTKTGAFFSATYGGTVDVRIRNSSFSNNGVSGAQGDVWGGGGTLKLSFENSNFSNNSNYSGGGIYYSASTHLVAELKVTNCNFTNNTATGGGGAIDFSPNTGTTAIMEIANSTFNGNNGSLAGGAVQIVPYGNATSATVRILNSDFYANVASNGGAIKAERVTNGGLNLLIDGCNFDANTGSFQGGAYESRYVSPIIRNSTFTNNQSLKGGAAYIWTTPPVLSAAKVYNCEFRANTASGNGGALAFISWPGVNLPRVTNCSFIQNSAVNGGGIYNEALGSGANGSGNIVNCIFSRNSASTWGGGIYNGAWGNGSVSRPNIINCSFSLNSALNGGGLANASTGGDAGSKMENCIFWDNMGELFNSQTYTSVISNSLVKGLTLPLWFTTNGGNIMNQNPLFLSPLTDNLNLGTGSPAINSGVNSFIPQDLDDVDADANTTELIDVDLDLNPRVQFSTIDMGALESGLLTSVQEPAATQASRVFPSVFGAGQELRVQRESQSDTELRVLTATGIVLESYWISGQMNSLPTHNWPTGMYLIQVGEEIHKVIKVE